jgi:hypothetical protein
VGRTFIAKIRKEVRGKRREPEVTPAQYEAFLGLLRSVSMATGKHTACEDGSRWWRLFTEWTDEGGEQRRSIYGFVRKVDGALFIADGWHKPRKDGEPVGFLHDHRPDRIQSGPPPCSGAIPPSWVKTLGKPLRRKLWGHSFQMSGCWAALDTIAANTSMVCFPRRTVGLIRSPRGRPE